jgi:hypothetical protein
MRVGPRIPVLGIQLEKAEVGPTAKATWHISHLEEARGLVRRRAVDGAGEVVRVVGDQAHGHALDAHKAGDDAHLGFGRIVGSEIEAPNMLANLV